MILPVSLFLILDENVPSYYLTTFRQGSVVSVGNSSRAALGDTTYFQALFGNSMKSPSSLFNYGAHGDLNQPPYK